MKNSLLRALACLAFGLALLPATAQDALTEIEEETNPLPAEENSVRIGLRGGLNLSKLGGSNALDEHDLKNKTGFHVGVVADIPLRAGFYLQPGLFLSAKGTKAQMKSFEQTDKQEQVRYAEEQNARMLFVEIPILASYHLPLSNQVELQVGTGPFFAYGVDGKTKRSWISEGVMGIIPFSTQGEDEVKTFKHSDDSHTPYGQLDGMKRFDAGWNVSLGLTYLNIYLGISYEIGFVNLCDPDAWGDDASLRTRNLAVSVGYNF